MNPEALLAEAERAERKSRHFRMTSSFLNDEGNLVAAEFHAKLANDLSGDARWFRDLARAA